MEVKVAKVKAQSVFPVKIRHAWDISPSQARSLQQRLARRIIRNDKLLSSPRWVAGVDVGFEKAGSITRAAVVVLDSQSLQPVEAALARAPTRFPYVPGLLSFREIPAILVALGKLSVIPDLLLCDGQGYAHPRRLGLASHLGVLTDLPSIGVAKSRLVGEHTEPGAEKGASAVLWDHGEIIGTVLRTRHNVKPLFISVGHRISLETAVGWVLRMTPRYRLPETTRLADRLASRRGLMPGNMAIRT